MKPFVLSSKSIAFAAWTAATVLLISFTAAQDIMDSNNVIQLTSDNFKTAIEAQNHFVKFYAPWYVDNIQLQIKISKYEYYKFNLIPHLIFPDSINKVIQVDYGSKCEIEIFKNIGHHVSFVYVLIGSLFFLVALIRKIGELTLYNYYRKIDLNNLFDYF